jgi:hypothetical protein
MLQPAFKQKVTIMSKVQSIKAADIVLDNRIYPRSSIDHKRVSMFEENMRDGFEFDPIHLEVHPDEPGKYRILDGAHRFNAYKGIGQKEVTAEIIKLNGKDPLLYAARQAIGPRLLNEEEARNTARRAYQNNPKLSSEEIGKDVGRSRQAVDIYIADLRASFQQDINQKIFHMVRLGIPQQRISDRLNILQSKISGYLSDMLMLANPINNDLRKGFTVSQVAEKHGWPESLVWSLKLESKNDLAKCEELRWKIEPWDYWDFNDNADRRFGDDWTGRISAQIIANILYFFSKEGDLVFDPMAGGGVVADTCLALNRRCWSFDMTDRPDNRPEIEPYFWDIKNPEWPVNGKTKPDLIVFDPPYYKGEEEGYISKLEKEEYLKFLEAFLKLASENSKKSTRLAMICADWRDFWDTPARDESPEKSILINDYADRIKRTGWDISYLIRAPMSPEKFQDDVAAEMEKKKILGVTGRYVVVAEKAG